MHEFMAAYRRTELNNVINPFGCNKNSSLDVYQLSWWSSRVYAHVYMHACVRGQHAYRKEVSLACGRVDVQECARGKCSFAQP